MTRTISLITATVGAALLFAVPAWGDNWGADRQDPPVRASPDIADLLAAKNGTVPSSVVDVLSQSRMLDAREQSLSAGIGNGKVSALDARERSFTAKQDAQLVSTPAPDWFERAAATAIRDNREIVVDDRFRLHPQSVPSPVTATSSGREIDLPQIGIGFGFGLLLALGLYLAMRFTRIRPLAH